MKQIMDKLKNEAKKRKKIILFLLGIAFIGFITGTTFITILSETDKNLVKDYITEFIDKIKNHKLDYLNSFKNAFLSNIIFILTIWILGLSVVGIPINIFIYFTKAFILGFSISSFILKYKVKGCLLSLIYIFPHHIINIVIYTVLLIFSINFSKRIIFCMKSKKPISFQATFKKYCVILLFSILLIFLTTLIEIFLTPFLLEKLLFVIK